jgi:hypothetical protein
MARTPTAIILFLLAAVAQAADRPYLAVIEKVAGAVGFYTEMASSSG